ncbi:hypothetical protein DFP72DRAFT_274671 [Ephemerocybe angulata]|uniref:Uncharacterized protein n=1 Tax=Ephemerocybe angulata TaxID=980116 RepID=A0A8H6I0L5_9AGAR|nr:hypothetical protein DFP72DRAFT_274671 [Tulosesus angulatus]
MTSLPLRPQRATVESGYSQGKLLDASEDGTLSMYTAQTGTAVNKRRFEDSSYLVPPPGYNGIPPEKYDPLLMRLPIILGEPFMLLILGLALEIVAAVSKQNKGFNVPAGRSLGVFGQISSQFLASFIPTLLIIPPAVLWRELDWMVRMYQPYLVLSEGNADAERSVLLNYIEIGPILAIPRALKYKHRLVFASCLTASLTYLFQPFTASVFQIRTLEFTRPWLTTVSLETVARAPDVESLQAFMAGAGYADAAVLHDLPDPKFVKGGWATARFSFPVNPLVNATLFVETVAVRTQTNCSNPTSQQLTPDGTFFNLTATSLDSCTHSVRFDPTVLTLTSQYGVEAAPCPGATSRNGEVDPQVEFRPVMFWYFHHRADNTPEAKTVFCKPKLTGNKVVVESDAKNGNLIDVKDAGDVIYENDVLNGDQGGRAYNGVVFTNNTNPYIQARADATRSLVPAAIFRSMSQNPGGLDSVFDNPNLIKDLTSKIYTQHLSVSAKGLYFQLGNSSLTATLRSLEPRLVVDPLPAHFLATILILTGIVGIIIHILHRNQRKKLRLSAEPGTIAAAAALTSRSGWGNLLTPYDGDITMEKKLDGLRFGLDKRTGAVIAVDERNLMEEVRSPPADDTMTSFLSSGAMTPPLSSTFSAYQVASGNEPWKNDSKNSK